MGTEVLRPHDCLTERIGLPPAMVYPRRRSHPVKPSRSKPAPVRSEQKKATESSPTISRRRSLDDLKPSKHKNNQQQQQQQLVMGQITILKRGEPLDLKPKLSSGNYLIVSGTERIGPDPVSVTKQVRIRDPKPEGRSRSLSPTPAVYAGSAFSVSPSPESLPLPSFSKKKQVSMTVDDSATRDLRRLLRLD